MNRGTGSNGDGSRSQNVASEDGICADGRSGASDPVDITGRCSIGKDYARAGNGGERGSKLKAKMED